jgi:hypothetical protein
MILSIRDEKFRLKLTCSQTDNIVNSAPGVEGESVHYIHVESSISNKLGERKVFRPLVNNLS